MLKAVTIVLDEPEIQELYRILLDGDQAGALEFLNAHFRSKLRELMEGG